AGEALEEVLGALRRDDLVPGDVPTLVRGPRGAPADHPRIVLLRLRGLHVRRAWPGGGWVGARGRAGSGGARGELLDRGAGAGRAARPLADWLDAHVGLRDEPVGAAPRPSVAPADEQ